MSFDIFLDCRNGGTDKFSRAIVEEAFGPFIDEREDTHWSLARSNAEVWLTTDAELTGFMVSRPPGEGHPFWAALLAVMRKTLSVLYWPSAGPKPHCVVADEGVIANMPAEMI